MVTIKFFSVKFRLSFYYIYITIDLILDNVT